MMKKVNRVISIPVCVVEGKIVPQDGLTIPLVEGSEGQLMVEETAIANPAFVETYTKRQSIKLLPEGTELLVMMSDRTPFHLAPELKTAGIPREVIRPLLGQWFDQGRWPSFPRFIPVRIGKLLPWQDAPDGNDKGGLWLELEGMKSNGLVSSRIELPSAIKVDDDVASLNHAYTLLSEVFEPQRKSHTGNVYQKVLYREADNRWYPLQLFRAGATADARYEIARSAWRELLDELKSVQGKP